MGAKRSSPAAGKAGGGRGTSLPGNSGGSVNREVEGMTELVCDTQRLTAKTQRPARRAVRLPNVLSIGVPEGEVLDGVAHVNVRQPREIIEMLRVLHFNLLLVRAKS